MKQHRKPSVRLTAAITITACLLLGASSCDEPAQDRAKTEADGFQDATNVVVWRNADQVPNVVTFCADGLAWAATLSSDGYKTPNLLRLPERDSRCAK